MQVTSRPSTITPNSYLPSVFTTVASHDVPVFFSRYPAGISVAAVDVEAAMHAIGELASTEGSRERRRARIRHTNPYGDPFAVCHCTAFPDRLVLLSSLVEVMWIHDDVTEEMDHTEACKAHAELAAILRLDIDPSSIDSNNNPRLKALAEVLRKTIDIDPAKAPAMIEMLKTYLATFDNVAGNFTRLEEYMPHRIANCGYWMSSYFIRWGMNMDLSDSDYASIEQYDIAMGNVLGLTNDYFSWHIEKDQETDRMRNAVMVLMKEHRVTAEAAKMMLLGIIVDEESRAAKLKEERLKSPTSQDILQYFEAIELYVGGSCYWHSTAPRYQIFE
ncbi:terpene synthase family protein [Aspergillus ibericus CBS 121593]|uniref:Terpenoid synthase n=1 Tax=Aspergillus ibericus CBS 121593 TaxID=1448316 RepID=A0A395H7C6_9EURO|nr:terpenoid synthase [Aspergillus ibericus CBS 121593]RAL03065.1 terpenoid synthase [Aspergillus ibericus CBS 121593]